MNKNDGLGKLNFAKKFLASIVWRGIVVDCLS